ncbi:amidohydrolase family protein [Parahaliea mediterranea]|uniref:amidohydrolase family protein n=1 Tax=Parahaliea mediterranea TaxID=651086 RepID=UPI000E2EAAEA|nr:amidohydrolase family protein [Parahaliea mediterranea]
MSNLIGSKPFPRLALCMAVSLWAQTAFAALDIAIVGGRVVDPESGLDAVRNVGIEDGRIVAVSSEPLEAERIIDAGGRVVAPGFIDMHAHGQSILGGRVQALDGVTTALDLEAGSLPIADFYAQAGIEGRPINYGVSVNWAYARIAVFQQTQPEANPGWFFEHFGSLEWQRDLADDTQLQAVSDMVEQGIREGGLGVGVLLGYAPGTGRHEYYQISALAADYDVPTFTHARYLSMIEPESSFEAMAEIVAAAAGTGVQAHIVHLNSISLRDIDAIGALLAGARERGLRISTEAYPYGAGSTGIGAAMFRGPHWRERIGGATAASFEVDGERLDEARLAQLQKEQPGKEAVIHFLETERAADQAYLDQAVLFPEGVIASDGMGWMAGDKPVTDTAWPLPPTARNHPRSAGAYSRFLRQYVRESEKLSLLEAIERVSYGPARILQDAVPQMRRKGRIQPGADADIVVFDLAEITDNATYAEPAQVSTGFDYVLVNGVPLVDGGRLDTAVLPGKAIRNPVRDTPVPGDSGVRR